MIKLEPELGGSFKQGLYLPQEGQIDNRHLLTALQKQLDQEGVHWFSETLVNKITSTEHSSHITCEKKGHHLQSQQVDLVIDCRGTGASIKHAGNHCAPLADLRSVRGELFRLFAPDVNLSRPIRLMHPRYQLYIAPKGKGTYVVGATEIESDDNTNMTVRSAMELLSAAYSVHSGFAEANIVQHLSQTRPAFSDNQPKITVKGSLIQVNGLFRHGFLIAPVLIEQVLALVNNKLTGKAKPLPYDHLLAVQSITSTIEQAPLTSPLTTVKAVS